MVPAFLRILPKSLLTLQKSFLLIANLKSLSRDSNFRVAILIRCMQEKVFTRGLETLFMKACSWLFKIKNGAEFKMSPLDECFWKLVKY